MKRETDGELCGFRCEFVDTATNRCSKYGKRMQIRDRRFIRLTECLTDRAANETKTKAETGDVPWPT